MEQVHGPVVPSTCSGRSCWPTACQAPLIRGVSHVQCPPRRPLSPPAWCRFHTRQDHHKDVCGGGGSARGAGLCLLLAHTGLHPITSYEGGLPPLSMFMSDPTCCVGRALPRASFTWVNAANQQPWERGAVVTPTLQIRKLRHRRKSLSQVTAQKAGARVPSPLPRK